MNISLPAVPISLSRYSGRGCRLGDRESRRRGIFNERKNLRKREVHFLEEPHWIVVKKSKTRMDVALADG